MSHYRSQEIENAIVCLYQASGPPAGSIGTHRVLNHARRAQSIHWNMAKLQRGYGWQ